MNLEYIKYLIGGIADVTKFQYLYEIIVLLVSYIL